MIRLRLVRGSAWTMVALLMTAAWVATGSVAALPTPAPVPDRVEQPPDPLYDAVNQVGGTVGGLLYRHVCGPLLGGWTGGFCSDLHRTVVNVLLGNLRWACGQAGLAGCDVGV